MLMVLMSLPAFTFAHESNAGGKKGTTHSDNGKHKGWYKDGHKQGKNVKGKGHSKKKAKNAGYAYGTAKKPAPTISNGGAIKNTGGASAKPIPTTNEGGVAKGSATMSNTGGSAKASGTTSSQGGQPKN